MDGEADDRAVNIARRCGVEGATRSGDKKGSPGWIVKLAAQRDSFPAAAAWFAVAKDVLPQAVRMSLVEDRRCWQGDVADVIPA
jgi:hypothetical protein